VEDLLLSLWKHIDRHTIQVFINVLVANAIVKHSIPPQLSIHIFERFRQL